MMKRDEVGLDDEATGLERAVFGNICRERIDVWPGFPCQGQAVGRGVGCPFSFRPGRGSLWPSRNCAGGFGCATELARMHIRRNWRPGAGSRPTKGSARTETT